MNEFTPQILDTLIRALEAKITTSPLRGAIVKLDEARCPTCRGWVYYGYFLDDGAGKKVAFQCMKCKHVLKFEVKNAYPKGSGSAS